MFLTAAEIFITLRVCQIELLVAYGENQRSLFAKRWKVNLSNLSKSFKSFFYLLFV